MRKIVKIFRDARIRRSNVIEKWELLESGAYVMILLALGLFALGVLYKALAVMLIMMGAISAVFVILCYIFALLEKQSAALISALATAALAASTPALASTNLLWMVFLNGFIGLCFILGCFSILTKTFGK